MRQNTYSFVLILEGISEISDEIQEALLRAGCDDALLGIRNGVPYLDFDREAESLEEAVLSAIADVQNANIGAEAVRVEPDDLVTASEIARRLARSRENVRQLIQGERGPGDFPPPVSSLTRTSPLYRWSEVSEWSERLRGKTGSATKTATDIATINAALELVRRTASQREAVKLLMRVPKAKGRKRNRASIGKR